MPRQAAVQQLPGLATLCPHCGGRHTHLERVLAEDGPITADRWRCSDCRRAWWQLHPPLAPAAG